MKRDFDLVRSIMAHIEKVPAGHYVDGTNLQHLNEQYGRETVSEHVNLLMEEGLINGKIHEAFDGIDAFVITGLTWKGHDFLDAARDESIWLKAKETILKPAASITFSLLLDWLKQEAKAKLGLP